MVVLLMEVITHYLFYHLALIPALPCYAMPPHFMYFFLFKKKEDKKTYFIIIYKSIYSGMKYI